MLDSLAEKAEEIRQTMIGSAHEAADEFAGLQDDHFSDGLMANLQDGGSVPTDARQYFQLRDEDESHLSAPRDLPPERHLPAPRDLPPPSPEA